MVVMAVVDDAEGCWDNRHARLVPTEVNASAIRCGSGVSDCKANDLARGISSRSGAPEKHRKHKGARQPVTWATSSSGGDPARHAVASPVLPKGQTADMQKLTGRRDTLENHLVMHSYRVSFGMKVASAMVPRPAGEGKSHRAKAHLTGRCCSRLHTALRHQVSLGHHAESRVVVGVGGEVDVQMAWFELAGAVGVKADTCSRQRVPDHHRLTVQHRIALPATSFGLILGFLLLRLSLELLDAQWLRRRTSLPPLGDSVA